MKSLSASETLNAHKSRARARLATRKDFTSRQLTAQRCIVVILGAFLLALSAFSLHAQVGNNNPGGPSGIFNGQAGGCGYDPYTGNATRSITDISVAGAVGEYPLALVRTANSRAPSTTEVFGMAGGWNHNYNWILEESEHSQTENFHPKRYTVEFPDGRVETFRAVTWDSYYRVRPGADTPAQGSSAGVRERFVQLNLNTMFAYLVLPDGGKIEFKARRYTNGNRNQWWYKYHATAIYDPYGLKTQLVSSTTPNLVWRRLDWVIEPAGRWLHFLYTGPNNPKIHHIDASDGRTVNYYYAYCNGCRLSQVRYYNNPAWDAHYQYTGSNVGQGLPPLLWTADDPMYSGPMKRIAYQYKPATPRNPDNTAPVYGQILSERYYDGTNIGVAVSTLTVGEAPSAINHRKETRPDGTFRTFIYNGAGPGYLGWVSDFANPAHQSNLGYDGKKYVNSVTNFNRVTTEYTNNPITGKVTQVQFPAITSPSPAPRGTVNYTYTNDYYLHTIQDEGNHTTTITRRPADNRVSQIDYPDGAQELFYYDANHLNQTSSHRMTTGGWETFAYDGLHRVQYYSDAYHSNPGNPSIHYFYDSLDRLEGVLDALNHPTNFDYNLRGQVTVTTLPPDPFDGNQRNTVINAYNPDGTLQRRTDELGHFTDYTYDDYRRLKSVTPPLRGDGTGANTTRFYYGANPSDNVNDYKLTDSNVTWLVLPSGKKTKTVYDDNRRKWHVTVGSGSGDDATTSYTYDWVGNLRTITNPLNHNNVSTLYDERNRPYSISVGGQTTMMTYDTAGRQKTITRPNGQVITNVSFDDMNRVLQQNVTQTPDPTATTKYEYYPGSGLLHTMKDPRLVATNSTEKYEYTYDAMGRKAWVIYPKDSYNQNRSEHFTYDDVGRLYQFKNRAGNVQTFTYDALNRMTRSDWNDSTPDVSFRYDAASRLTDINNANATIARAYWNDNLLGAENETITGGNSKAIIYFYDDDGNRGQIYYPDDELTFTYAYTGRNQLEAVGPWATYQYDARGNLTFRTLANDTASSFSYDALDRVYHIAHALNGTGRRFDYGYDNVGNRKWTKRDQANGDVFRYDLADQAIAVKLNIANPDTTPAGDPTILYDWNGNRNWYAPYYPAEQYEKNDLNQYTSRTIYYTGGEQTDNAAHDFKGNLTTGLDGSAYQYDAQNRLTRATKGSVTMDFKYDGLNRQVSRSETGQPITFNVWDGWDLIEEYGAGGAPTAYYLYGASGLIFGAANGQFNYYYQDGSGSTSHVTDENGSLKEWYRYDLQGTPFIYDANNNQLSTTNRSVRHLFTGQQWYADIGLYDLRNRFYSPDIGRFLQPDPIGFRGDRTNLYRYVKNNPVTRRDPFGLQVAPVAVESDRVIVEAPPLPDPSDISDTGFLPGDLATYGPFSYNPEAAPGHRFHRDYNPFPRPREDNQPSVQHPPPSNVPEQNPDLPDPSAALYPPGGTLTLQEANYWYMNGGGKPAVVDATRLDFSAVNPNRFNRKTGRQSYTFPKFQGVTPSQDFLVYGTVTLQLTSDGTFGVLTDTYNFEMHPWRPGRNILTIIGNINANPNPFMHGTPYPIIFYNTVPVP